MTIAELRDRCASDDAFFARLIEEPLAVARELGYDVSIDGLKELLGVGGVSDDEFAEAVLRRLQSGS